MAVGVCVQYLVGVCAVGQNVQQICGGDEVEAGEGQPLGVQILGQGLLTQGQPVIQRNTGHYENMHTHTRTQASTDQTEDWYQ